ncbi:MAG TPA: tetratricopeptide repeat protein [Terriglobales bacterium]|nr:tetratricopeptide repeat protein [Terriglobales bacterium]
MAGNSPILVGLIAGLLLLNAAGAQTTHTTIRHRKVPTEDPSYPPELQQAEAAIQNKDYATAEPLLKKVAERDPANYQAWFDLGFVYNAKDQVEESIAAYRKSVAAKPDVFESNLNLGLMLAKTDQPGSAQFLRAATALKPTAHVEEGQARAWLSLGHVLEASKPGEALVAYHHAAELQPKDPEPHLSAGSLLERQNQFAEAEQEYRQVLTIDPKSADALIGISNIYTRGTRFIEAANTLRQLVTVRPDYAPGHFQLGRVLAADQKYDDAAAEFQAGLKLAPDDKAAQKDLADVYAAAGKYDQAVPLYQALIAGAPNDPVLHQSLGQLYMKKRDFPAAEPEFLAAVKLKPDFGNAYWDLANAANENKNYPRAIQALDWRAKFLPENPGSYFLRATAYDHLRAYKEAALNYHRFLEVANGQFPDQEWQARHRLIAIEPKK